MGFWRVVENERVLATLAALQSGDVAALRPLFAASHASMRDDYKVSVPPVDRLVELADAEPDVLGARLTGGGSGGSVIVVARRDRGRDVAARVAAAHDASSGYTATVLVANA